MSLQSLKDLNEAERETVLASGTPEFPDGSYDIDEIQIVMDALTDGIQPFASYVLNRARVWLEGDGRWGGDDTFAVEWHDWQDGRSCTLTKKDDGATWVVDILAKRVVPGAQGAGIPETMQITISAYEQGAGTVRIARGDISNGGRDSLNMRIREGAVDGRISLGAFSDLCRFAQAVRGSIPSDLLAFDGEPDFHAFLPMLRVVHAATIDSDLLVADGGLPGRHALARQAFVTELACNAVGGWMRDRMLPLAGGLRAVGAEWGKAVMSYNDGDYSCCSVDFADGAKGYFGDNASTGGDAHSFVAKIETGGDGIHSVGVNVLKDDDPNGMAAILACRKPADFIYDFGSATASFPGGRDGWTAMSLLFWQFVTDSNCALQEGELDDADHWWAGIDEARP